MLHKTGAELQQFLEQKMQAGLFTADLTSDATKFDGVKEEAVKTAMEGITPANIISRLKQGSLSQEGIDIFLEVLSERCIKFGKVTEATSLAEAIESPEIKKSIQEQLLKEGLTN